MTTATRFPLIIGCLLSNGPVTSYSMITRLPERCAAASTRGMLQDVRLCNEEARIEPKWLWFTPYKISIACVVGVEQDVEFFGNHNRGDLTGKSIARAHP